MHALAAVQKQTTNEREKSMCAKAVIEATPAHLATSYDNALHSRMPICENISDDGIMQECIGL